MTRGVYVELELLLVDGVPDVDPDPLEPEPESPDPEPLDFESDVESDFASDFESDFESDLASPVEREPPLRLSVL